MDKAYLLTGAPGVGKTTALKEIVHGLGIKHCGGFYTEELCAAGERYGFRIVTLDGQSGMLADVTYPPPKVGKYGVTLAFLEEVALPSVLQAYGTKRFIIVDEIGLMQRYSAPFRAVVSDVLMSDSTILIGTIAKAADPWLDEIRRRSDIEIIELTRENRDTIPAQIVKLLMLDEKHAKAMMYVGQPERFRLCVIMIEMKSLHGTRLVSLCDNAWRCTCDFFQDHNTCSHTMAAQIRYGNSVEP